MCYQSMLDSAREILEAHNKKTPQQIEIDQVFTKLVTMGGNNASVLENDTTWEDLEDCGVPKILSERTREAVGGAFRLHRPC